MFQWAVSPASWTLPSHAAMFTGREAGELRLGWNTPLGDRYRTIAEVLSARGYATAGFVANQYYGSDLFGLDRGFGRWEDQPVQPGLVVTHSWLARSLVRAGRHLLGNHQELSRKSADYINASFLRWLDLPRDRPFLAFLNYFDPHEPYFAPSPWNLRFSERPPRYWLDGFEADVYTEAERVELATAYESSIAYLDDRLRMLFTALRERGVLRRTLVVVTSDHGEDFGAGGKMGHQYDLTMPLIHVPLVLVYPGKIPAGTQVGAPVELRHLAPTVLALAGAMDTSIAGESLARFWAGPAAASSEPALSDDGDYASLVTDSYHFLRSRTGEERLFEYRADYMEQRDLSSAPALAGIRDSLRALLDARLHRPRE